MVMEGIVMTQQMEVQSDEKYRVIHNCGFVGVVDVMGSDRSIVRAARVSYGEGTKKVQDDRNLIRYLMRHRHTTPFEMCEIVFHLKMPIFIARQWVRHRTASINEYSARYSVMTDEFYVPEIDYLKKQSKTNNQGSDGDITQNLREIILVKLKKIFDETYKEYDDFLTLDLSRELSRMILPVSNYTEMYWKMNLHNLFHFLKLRTDSHAQQEIQDYANAVLDLAKPYFPIAFEAWEDYVKDAVTFSRKELNIIEHAIKSFPDIATFMMKLKDSEDFDSGLSKREWNEFIDKFELTEGK